MRSSLGNTQPENWFWLEGLTTNLVTCYTDHEVYQIMTRASWEFSKSNLVSLLLWLYSKEDVSSGSQAKEFSVKISIGTWEMLLGTEKRFGEKLNLAHHTYSNFRQLLILPDSIVKLQEDRTETGTRDNTKHIGQQISQTWVCHFVWVTENSFWEWKTMITCTRMCTAASLIIENKQSEYPSVGEWTNQMWWIHHTEYFKHIEIV